MQGVCVLVRLSVQDEEEGHGQSVGSRSNLGSTHQHLAVWPIGTNLHTASSLKKTPVG